MSGRWLSCAVALACLADGAGGESLPVPIPSFEGRFILNWPDTAENKALRAFLETNEGRPVFLELEIDASVSTEDQVEIMKSCKLDRDAVRSDSGQLLHHRLGFPERFNDQVNCWNWLFIDSQRQSLPENGASTGIVWYNLDGFFFVRGEVHGDGPQSFNLRELDADAETWSRATAE